MGSPLNFQGEATSYLVRPKIKLPDTSTWTWYCCKCEQAHFDAEEANGYSVCTKGPHAQPHTRCRTCQIRWCAETVEQQWLLAATKLAARYRARRLSKEAFVCMMADGDRLAKKAGIDVAWMDALRKKMAASWGLLGSKGEGAAAGLGVGVAGGSEQTSHAEDGATGVVGDEQIDANAEGCGEGRANS